MKTCLRWREAGLLAGVAALNVFTSRFPSWSACHGGPVPRSRRYRRPAAALAAVVAAVVISACGGGGTASAGQAIKNPSGPAPVTSSDSPDLGAASASAPAPSAGAPSGPAPSGPALSGSDPGVSGSQGPTSQYLQAMNPVAGSGDLSTGSAEVNGKYYANSVFLSVDPGPANVSYNLGRQWRQLDTTVGLSDDSPENEKVQFQIIADDRIIYNGVLELGQSKKLSLNVTNVLRLELVATLASPSAGETNAVWGNAEITN